ncbi:MAG: hypothetical protein ACRBBW_13025 [Cellvibrionaceae bacterium]
MKQISEIANKAMAMAVTPAKNRPLSSSELSEVQAKIVGYFFLRLRDFDPERFDRQYPSVNAKSAARRINAPFVKDWTSEYIDDGFAKLKRARQADSEVLKFWVIDDVIGFILNGGHKKTDVVAAGMYTEFKDRDQPKQLVDEKQIHRRRKVASNEIDNMKSMLGL